MSPFVIVLGAALIDIGANMAINRSKGFRYKGGDSWGSCWYSAPLPCSRKR